MKLVGVKLGDDSEDGTDFVKRKAESAGTAPSCRSAAPPRVSA